MQGFLPEILDAIASEASWVIVDQLCPIAPKSNPGRLYDVYRASNEQQIGNDVYSGLRYGRGFSVPEAQANAWSDIVSGYWKAVRQILQAEEAKNKNRAGDRSMVDVYDAWKAFASAIHTHIDRGNLPPWAVILMYRTANYLRLFASKADDQIMKSKGKVTTKSSLIDDDVSTKPTPEKLPDAIRLFNKMFSSCMGDR